MNFLMNLTLFLFGSYILSIVIYHAMTKDGFKASRDAIDSVIQESWKYLKGLLPKEEETEYMPDEILIQKLMICLSPYSELPMAYAEWKYYKYSKFELPAIKIQLICKTEENFPIIRNILNNVFKEHSATIGLQNPYSVVRFEKSGENCYYLILVYAVSDNNKEKFKNLAHIKKKHAEFTAKKSVQTVVDNELENELRESLVDNEEK